MLSEETARGRMSEMILLLTQSYQPISAVTSRKCADLVLFRQKAEVVCHYPDGRPAAIRLIVKTPDPRRWMRRAENTKYRKNNVFTRDDFTCVYCGYKSLIGKNLTIDHVLPRSRGGSSTYKNCVTACKTCNNIKDCYTPEEAGMKMSCQQRSHAVDAFYFVKDIPEEWKIFL